MLIIKTVFKNKYGSLIDFPRIHHPAPLGIYNPQDVTFLLKDLGQLITEQGNEEREWAIQSGSHYSEMLPIEYEPTQEYVDLFHTSLKETGYRLAKAISIVSEVIFKKQGKKVVLVSLARAGTPIGVLIKRYIRRFHLVDLPHYTISIIRDKGIDRNALIYILQNHPEHEIQFIDGWTGKGAITMELIKSIDVFEKEFSIIPGTICKDLAVLADPGYCANIFGTREDFLIPSACLNSTVSGLMSRTVYREDLITPHDFHGAKYYKELINKDLSNYFVSAVSTFFETARKEALALLKENPECGIDNSPQWIGKKETIKIQIKYGIKNINYVKPGVGETTRVLLRRIPWKILVKSMDNPDIKHILLLAKDKGVQVEEYQDLSYSCYGLIKNMGESE